MDIVAIKQDIEAQLASASDKGVKMALDFVAQLDEDSKHEMVILSNQFHTCHREYRIGRISWDEYFRYHSKNVSAILFLVQEVFSRYQQSQRSA